VLPLKFLQADPMNAPNVLILLIVCMLVMHVMTLIVIFYKDRISQFLDEMSTDVLLSEMRKRGYFSMQPDETYESERAPAMPAMSAFDEGAYYREPRASMNGPPPLPAFDRPNVMPMQDPSGLAATACDQFQPFHHPAFGHELNAGEGLVGAEKAASWNTATVQANAPRTCKNYVNVNVS
jgi:hypothetical protein